jgi:uncharacterized protein YjbJ (UPF0337 family)
VDPAQGQDPRALGKLTDDEIEQMQGNTEQLIGKVQERYGRTREQAEQEVDRWLRDYDQPQRRAS